MNDHKGIQRKSKLSSTIAQIKKDSTNIRQKSKSKPKSKSKGKVVTSKYNYESLNSPKPIEYSKVMKKFGNNIVSYREQPTTPKNNTITYELNDNIGIITDKITVPTIAAKRIIITGSIKVFNLLT